MHRVIAPGPDYHILPQLAVQCVGDRVGIRNGGNGAVRQRRLKQQPGITLLLSRFRERFLKPKTASRNEIANRGQQAWISRLIKIKTTGVIAWTQTEQGKMRVA